jgi:DNA-binding IclR family transcriptional regulator
VFSLSRSVPSPNKPYGRESISWKKLSRARPQGYAVDDAEVADHVCCFATALPWSHPPVGAISVSLPSYRATEEVRAKVVASLLEVRQRAGVGPRNQACGV